MWYTQAVAFNPDYIYIAPKDDGAYPSYGSWQEATAGGLPLAVVTNSPRIDALRMAKVPIKEVNSAKIGLAMVADGQASGFVGSAVDFVSAISGDQKLIDAGLGWVRNKNSHTHGDVYGWGIKAGNAKLADAIDDAITAAWQKQDIAQIYRHAFAGTNVTALLAPGPTAIGTSYGASKDFKLESSFLAGPWTQRAGWNQ